MSDNQNDKAKQYLLQNHLITVTIFGNFAAKSMEIWDMTLPEIGQMILAENRKRKNMLPWLKMAEFGELRTAKGSLRHDANVKWINGVEVDHDSGRPIAEAIAQLAAAGIRALVYTSPSHLLMGNDGIMQEKWRVLAPTSGPLPPEMRVQLTARLNGVLKGAAAAESFVLSQSYYFGSVDHNPAHAVEIIDGDFIDLADDLDAGAIGSPGQAARKKRAKAAPEGSAAPNWSEADLDRLVATAGDLTEDGTAQWHENMRSVTSSMVGKMKTDLEIHEKCEPGYGDERGYDDVQKLIDTARAKYGVPNPEDDAEFAEMLGSVREDAKAEGAAGIGSALPPEPDRKPVIRIGKLDEMVDAAAQALLDAGEEFYQRGGMLVRPVILDMQSFDGEPTFSAQLIEVNSHYMRDVLSRRITWLRFDKKSSSWLPTNPPMDVALVLLSKFGDWPFRVLAGIITTQTLRPDGTILSDPGYDAATQLLLINPPAMQPIADKPSYEAASAALKLLKALLAEFPFTIDEEGRSLSRAVGLSAIVSTICRGAYPVVPMHAIDAPAAGTGKSYLLSTVSWISTGQPMAVMSAGKTVEETEKRLGAAVIAGQTMICIDNVEGELGGDALCQLVEQVRPKVRILGQSKLIEVDGRSMCLFANGNNITLVGDIYRRVITCRLDAGIDRPEKRQFTLNPRTMILADRGAYVAACSTIARAYQVAGRPGRMSQIGSFNEWSDCVRSALVWLGEADCIETMDDARAEDPHRLAQEALLAEWRNVFGKRLMLLRDVAAKCEERTAGERVGGAMPYTYGELRAAVQATNHEAHRQNIDLHALGQKMRQYKDQWVGGMRFVKVERSGETLWNAEASSEGLRTKPKGYQKKPNEIKEP